MLMKETSRSRLAENSIIADIVNYLYYVLSMELGEPEYKEKNDKKTKLKGGLGWIR